jgi:hypothetical protein
MMHIQFSNVELKNGHYIYIKAHPQHMYESDLDQHVRKSSRKGLEFGATISQQLLGKWQTYMCSDFRLLITTETTVLIIIKISIIIPLLYFKKKKEKKIVSNYLRSMES